ncbi:MAG: PQQ-dependent sugar dehydrogenase [Bacteroidota bacterium]
MKSIATTLILLMLAWANPLQAQDAPRALHSDITIEHYMDVADLSVRLELDDHSDKLYYTTFDGDIYRIEAQGEDELLYTADDHGITRLQGVTFHDGDLYLSGNIEVNDDLGTKGLVMRGRLQESGERVWEQVAITVEHGGAQTTFDHGFNDIVVDPAGEWILVNSGARTDHGEVQHNNDNYPGQREVPTTAVILKLPIDGKDILLTHDRDQIEPYTFARGVRNIYSMNFSPKGDLFGVSNSGDYDHPEDMFWLRDGHHYGFPWIMGGVRNPQQDPDWQPDPDEDLLLPRFSHAFNVGYFYNDPEFPQMPEHLIVTPSVQNLGPHADYYRDPETGEPRKASLEGRTIGTFSPHRSPLGVTFDHEEALAAPFTGDGFVIGYSGMTGGMSRDFGGADFGEQEGRDLMHMKLIHMPAHDNYAVEVTRIADQFASPTDAVLIGNEMYVINYARSDGGSIWKVTLPAAD